MTAVTQARLLLPPAFPKPALRAPAQRLRSPAAGPALSVVIVNYHQWAETAALTRQLLGSVAARRGIIEVVIVDNASPAHPLRGKLRRWPGVSLRRWHRNRGFARAVNEGCRLSRGRWLLLLNPDVSLAPGFARQVLRFAQKLERAEPRAGVVGFHLRNGDGSLQLSSGWFPTLTSTLARLIVPRPRRKYTVPDLERASRVPWVTGCCWLLRRECLEELQGFDEDYFLYYEDVDFCRRAQAAGWSVWYEPTLRVVHHRPLHARQVTLPLRIYTRHALLTYASKHWQPWQLRILSGIVRAEAWMGRRWALCQGRRRAADQFGELGAIAADFAQGSRRQARRRLERVVRRQERPGGC